MRQVALKPKYRHFRWPSPLTLSQSWSPNDGCVPQDGERAGYSLAAYLARAHLDCVIQSRIRVKILHTPDTADWVPKPQQVA